MKKYHFRVVLILVTGKPFFFQREISAVPFPHFVSVVGFDSWSLTLTLQAKSIIGVFTTIRGGTKDVCYFPRNRKMNEQRK